VLAMGAVLCTPKMQTSHGIIKHTPDCAHDPHVALPASLNVTYALLSQQAMVHHGVRGRAGRPDEQCKVLQL
jgi:hypothetical protein